MRRASRLHGVVINGVSSIPEAARFHNAAAILTDMICFAVTSNGAKVRVPRPGHSMVRLLTCEGYETRFGVTYVDYAGGQKRMPKKSARVVQEMFTSLCEEA